MRQCQPPSFIFSLFLVESQRMKYLLPCKCGQSVEIEPSQAGQTVVCGCGENLHVPSMLQVKTLPIAPERSTTSGNKAVPSYSAAFIMLAAGIVCAILALPIGWLGWSVGLNGNFVFRVCLALGCSLAITAPIIALRTLIRSDDTNILSRTFFILGTVLLFSSLLLAISLFLWQPDPRQATMKRVFFSYGTYQRPLHQDSTPIPDAERIILWITDEDIDYMMPMDLYFYFQTLEEPTFSYNFRENYEAVWATHRIWITTNVILFILALLSVAASFFMPKQNAIVTGWSGNEW